MNLSILKNKISKLSQNPGVYIFYGKSGDSAQGGFRRAQIIYVGKATNLRSRVGSYFSLVSFPSSALRAPSPERRRGYGRPIEAMIHEVADIKTIQTDSVLEALILESNLIKQHQPKYNVKEKDDKSFSYFVITKEKFPRVLILRETELSPHPASGHPLPKLGEGVGVRVGKTFGPYTSKKQMEIALKIIRKIFPFHSLSQKTEKGCLDFQLGRCPGPYAGAITAEDYKKNIQGIRMILDGKKKSLVKNIEKEMKDFSKKHEYEKAAELRNKVFALKHIQDVALISEENPHPALCATFSQREKGNKKKLLRMEAYDISNISGQYAVGSMVVFSDDEPDKSQYRKFKIKTIQGADDVGMMREVLLRRFRHTLTPSPSPSKGEGGFWPQPDLIFLDGGKGHLNMGEKLLRELGFKIPMVAVAKGANRKSQIQISNFPARSGSRQGGDKLISNEIKNILDNKKLVKRIMDEAHRFAIKYHKKLRKNSLLM